MIVYSTALKESLFNLIWDEAFQHKDDLIRLASGKETHYYFDLKKVTGHPRGINDVASILYDQILTLGNIRSVGGLESGSISISTAISLLSYNRNPNSPLTSFYVRKEAKKHGLKKLVEGIITSPTVVVDDVVTSGKSAIDAVEALKSEGIDVNYLICIVYRDTPEMKKEFEKKYGIKLLNIFYEKEFTDMYEKHHRQPIEA